MPFLGDNYLLPTQQAAEIFAEIKDLPIIDPHNHSNTQEILANENYPDIWRVEAATDHYVWELMRKRGTPEEFITGTASNFDKWVHLAGIFDDFASNPVYEWFHLDLRNMLGITDRLESATAQQIWDESLIALKLEQNRPRELLRRMQVESMCTTDDPADVLDAHEQIAEEEGAGWIRPTWRPDRYANIFKADWTAQVDRLESRVQDFVGSIHTLGDLVAALQWTHDYFEQHGCLATDHGIQVPFGYAVEETRAEEVFQSRRAGNDLTPEDVRDYMSYMMHQFGAMNARSGWVTQVHMGAVRDVRQSIFNTLGPDSGGDVITNELAILDPLKDFLNAFDGQLKVVLYCLDPAHVPVLATLSRCFSDQVRVGAAWWYNDTPYGMRQHLECLASMDLLYNFPGMVADSRKILSFGSRTEMFRRVLAWVLGDMVKREQIPDDLATRLARHVCYEGPKEFFGFGAK
jgi:glucuronate isomerase